MAWWWLRTLAALAEDHSSNLSTHMAANNDKFQVVHLSLLSFTGIACYGCTYVHLGDNLILIKT